MELFRRAIRNQVHMSQQVITGQGIDNHLMGIRRIALDTGLPVPDFLKDSNFESFNHFELSTSQIPTGSPDLIMCYGPVVPNGYGCSYNPLNVSVKTAFLDDNKLQN